MTFWIAAKDEIDPYFAIFLFNNVMHGKEIDEAWISLLFSFSLLAALADAVVASLAGGAIYVDTKLQNGFTNRSGIIPNRGGSRNLDSTASSRWLPWEPIEDYIERDMCLATHYHDVFPHRWKWLYEGNPVGHTGRLLREDCTEVEWETHRIVPSPGPKLSSSRACAGIGSRP